METTSVVILYDTEYNGVYREANGHKWIKFWQDKSDERVRCSCHGYIIMDYGYENLNNGRVLCRNGVVHK